MVAVLGITGLLGANASAESMLQINTNSWSTYVSELGGDGGEFLALSTAFDGSQEAVQGQGYATENIFQNSSGWGFETFCLQETIDVGNNSWNEYSTSEAFTPDGPLTVGAAWLYGQFAIGALTGYDYSTTDGGRSASAAALQNAIWGLQGQPMYDGYTTTNDPFYVMALNLFGAGAGYMPNGSGQGAFAPNTPGGNGSAVALLVSNGNPQQDQLILVGGGQGSGSDVPDGGATVSLLGIIFAGLTFVRRKFKRS